ncbi:hypothetical protein [Enterococcus gallinarum]|jgi:hypothetical protein|uniref:Uncharacterized protein n=1 Tax=Enterococcus gallinarum TaxID=1353 RepID=A0ABD4ZXZ4_ENTGA|nr:hypothetical protein [Enterococcus gallinarum]MBX8978969.1 hypothetical protein [Enterococcus gallinarum]MDL4876147.1 hypothetical protein [Enterococcus gallinarum]MDL4921725.1 hypothetical protein [Enterococcus gallinarum]MDL4937629.1 hypothetical protein [Enterococcus gallinarum]MDL4983431.1 hypothetical protein [Enterococcus gallinarum]
MLFPEFKKYLEENSTGYNIFIEKATEMKNEKNKKRTGKTKKWSETKIQRQVEEMWKEVALNAYNTIRAEKGVPRYNGDQIWIDFMNENNFLEMFDDGMNELELE